MTRTARTIGLVVALVATLTIAGPASAAVAAPTPQAPPGRSSTVDWAALEASATSDGSVPLIVALDAPGRPPHELDGAQLSRQRTAVGQARQALKDELGAQSLRNLKEMDDLPLMAFHADAEQVAKLKRSPRVAEVVVDEERALPDLTGDQPAPRPAADGPSGPPLPEGSAPSATTNDGFTTQLANWWDYYRIGVDKAVARGGTGAGQTVAILDTGVESGHPWLAGDVVREACYATRTLGYTGGDCPNGTWTQTGAGSARPCTQAGCDHGTHVAHTAAGAYGVAPGARIIAVQVFHATSVGPRVWDSDLTWGLKFVYDLRGSYRIAAANMSLGGGFYSGYCDSSFAAGSATANVGSWLRTLRSVGIAPVVASGNDNYRNGVGQPACFSWAVSVGNTTMTPTGADAVFGNASYYDRTGVLRWTGSNSNATLDLLAPGTDVCSAVPGGRFDCAKSGTSMAAPHVAGAMAVLRQSRPAATVDQLQSALGRSGTGVYDSRNGITRTRIHVDNALNWIHSV